MSSFFADGFNPAVPVTALAVWDENPRKTIDQGKLNELAASIKAIGLQQPIVARPCDGGLEVIAGQRRFLAAQIAGLDTVPCMVRRLDDDQALEVAIAENAARTDVSPIEEAEAIEAYLRAGRTVEHAANRFGRSVSWVEGRMRLLSLTPTWRATLAADRCPVRHAELIARLAEPVQDQLARRFAGCDLPTFYEFERTVQLVLHRLAEAPFATTDDTYEGGACSVCPKRSDKQRDLFSDEASDADASCLDPTCWASKVEQLWTRAEKDAKKRKLRVLTGREAGLVGAGVCMPSAAWVESKRALARFPGLKVRAIARTDEGVVVELVPREDYDAAALAQLEALRQERDARKAMQAAEDEAEEGEKPAPAAPVEPKAVEPDAEPARAEDFEREAELLAIAITDPSRANTNRRAMLRFCGLVTEGAQPAIFKALGIGGDDWLKATETEDPRLLLDALLLDAVIACAKPGEIERAFEVGAAKSAATQAEGDADDTGASVEIIRKYCSEIEAARTAVDLGNAWEAAVSEGKPEALTAIARAWRTRADALGVKATAVKSLRKSGRAPAEAA
jgi:ParB/RepB/Spo0J family partition protein